MSREAMQLALEALEANLGNWSAKTKAVEVLHQALETDLARVGEVGVWGAVQCEPQEALEDGWCDWVCPKPQGYLMQCCDCELIHEVDFRVVQYEPKPSEVYEVVDDPNLQAQMRLRRRDDLSPKREWVGLTDEQVEDEWERITGHSIFGGARSEGRAMYISPDVVIEFSRAIESKLKEKNGGEYRNGATTERTKLNQENT
jgi:hypothetical protein